MREIVISGEESNAVRDIGWRRNGLHKQGHDGRYQRLPVADTGN